jgi:hypothetical protein
MAGGQQHSQGERTFAPHAATEETSVMREAHDALRAKGHPPTPQGVREFQQAKGLEATGRLDEPTLAALGVGVSASSGATSGPWERHDRAN